MQLSAEAGELMEEVARKRATLAENQRRIRQAMDFAQQVNDITTQPPVSLQSPSHPESVIKQLLTISASLFSAGVVNSVSMQSRALVESVEHGVDNSSTAKR